MWLNQLARKSYLADVSRLETATVFLSKEAFKPSQRIFRVSLKQIETLTSRTHAETIARFREAISPPVASSDLSDYLHALSLGNRWRLLHAVASGCRWKDLHVLIASPYFTWSLESISIFQTQFVAKLRPFQSLQVDCPAFSEVSKAIEPAKVYPAVPKIDSLPMIGLEQQNMVQIVDGNGRLLRLARDYAAGKLPADYKVSVWVGRRCRPALKDAAIFLLALRLLFSKRGTAARQGPRVK